MSTLLIFIDGLQHDLAIEKMPLLDSLKTSKVTPGIGFSNNLYPEMLCGTNPDEIGYFNEWSPLKNEVKKLPLYLRLLDSLRNYLYINVGIRRLVLRNIFGRDYSNIPFEYAHLFKPQGSHNFRDLGGDNLLHKYGFTIFDSVETKMDVGQRDLKSLEEINDKLEDKNYLLSLVDLDNLAHIYGTTSSEFLSHIDKLNSNLSNLVARFTSLNPLNQVYLFSDHGMVDVNKTVDFAPQIEARFGKMKENEYLYFIDSTYLRVWIKNPELRFDFERFLNGSQIGEIVGDKERVEFGLTNKEYGDIIFRLKEGSMFVPNFYGARPCKAMHGYSSYLLSQKAVFAKLDKNGLEYKLPETSKGIYYFLKNVLSS